MEKYGISFKEMDKKHKVMHIWEYYRYHILATIVTVCVVGALIKTIFFPAPPDDVDIMFAGQMYVDETYSDVMEDFKTNYKTGLDLTSINWEADGETASIMYQKIPLMMSTQELDIMAISNDTFDHFATIYGENMFMPLEDVPEVSDLLEKYKDNLYVCDKTVDDDGNTIDAETSHVYGIKVEKFNNIPCLAANEEMIVGLNPNAKDFEKTINMLKYILE